MILLKDLNCVSNPFVQKNPVGSTNTILALEKGNKHPNNYYQPVWRVVKSTQYIENRDSYIGWIDLEAGWRR